MVTVLIGADICPIEGNRPYFLQGDANALFHDLLPEFERADLVVANLECPLIGQSTPIFKTGPTFGESPECLNGIKAAGIDVLCLANNHIMDHGSPGLMTTLQACERVGLATVGAGENLEAARRILIRTVGSLRVGFLAVAEREFSIATPATPGANPLELTDCVRNIRDNRERFDYLIILVHGSAEFHVPTPRIQDTCRFFVEMGANAVIVQHPHVLGGWENYRGGHIVYGQGALVMDEAIYRSRRSFHEGFLVRLAIPDDGKSQMDVLPFEQSDPVPGARKLVGKRELELRRQLEERSAALRDPAFVEADWARFCEAKGHGYMSALLGYGRILRRFNRGGFVERVLLGRSRLASVRNLLSCETHREALQTILDGRLRALDKR